MDGAIELRSEPGETVFTLVLPVFDQAVSTGNAPVGALG